MKRKPKRVTVRGIEFDIPKVGEKSGARYEIVHVASGRSLRMLFTKRREAERWLTANIARVQEVVEAYIPKEIYSPPPRHR